MEPSAASSPETVPVARWPTELPLLVFVAVAALAIWALLAVSIFGLLYALLIGLVLFFAHLAFVTHVRGSAVRLGPRQLPDLHQRVVELSRRAGLDPAPDAYLMQSGGELNALASRFFRSRFIVLYSDLLDACEGDETARDMVIGHELGHLKAGHLDWMWLLVPGMFVPFLGSAYSRARELTCDRYGAALCGDRAGAVRGLTVLAAGREQASRVDLEAFAAQSRDLDTGWLTIGRWLARYPPLCERVSAIEPVLKPEGFIAIKGPTRAVLLLAGLFLLPPVVGGVFLAGMMAALSDARSSSGILEAEDSGIGDESTVDETWEAMAEEEIAAARERYDADFASFQDMLREYDARGLPEHDDIYDAWYAIHPDTVAPNDPFDGLRYGYDTSEYGRRLWSSGPDGEGGTGDDLERYFR